MRFWDSKSASEYTDDLVLFFIFFFVFYVMEVFVFVVAAAAFGVLVAFEARILSAQLSASIPPDGELCVDSCFIF